MKFILRVIPFLFVGNSFALDTTETGFYYPIGTANYSHACGPWLGRDPANGGCYFTGRYHIGEDMMTSGSFYSIASGKVFHKHCSDESWGPGNCALFIKHETSSDQVFTALYGHVRTTLKVGDLVTAGQDIGYAGPWGSGKHLHFGIRIGESVTPAPWGRLYNSAWPATSSFIDPIDFITTNQPKYPDYSAQNNFAWTSICGQNLPCEISGHT